MQIILQKKSHMPYPDVRLLCSNASCDTLFYRFSILTIVLASERENPLATMVTPPLVSMVMSQNISPALRETEPIDEKRMVVSS